MSERKVPGLPSVPENVWQKHKKLIAACRAERARGFKDGDDSYEAQLDILKAHAFDNNLLLGHIDAIEREYNSEHAA